MGRRGGAAALAPAPARRHKPFVEGRRKRVAVLSLGTEVDVWNAARITAAYGSRRDVESVEVIGWDITRDACTLLPGADVVHALPLSGLRARLQRHPLAGAIALKGAVDGIIGGRWFDVVLNLTYGALAGHLGPLFALDPHCMVGPFVDETGRWRASHPAFEYLATWGVDPELNVFALADVWSAGARVRTDEAGHFAPDVVARTLVEHACGCARSPVVVAPTRAAEAWLGFSWESLVSNIAKVGERPVMLVAPAGEEALVQRIADRTGADTARWPLRHTAALLEQCGTLITSDFGTCAFAARTGARQILLRDGGPLPIASLPGPHIVSMSGGARRLSLEAVLAFASSHLLQQRTPEPVLRSISTDLHVHELGNDNAGSLCATFVGDGFDTAAPTMRAWRRMWRDAWVGLPPKREDVALVLERGDPYRLARARLDRGPLGHALRCASSKREVAA